MGIITIGFALFVGLLFVLIISSLITRSRNATGSYPHHDNDLHSVHHAGFLGYSGHTEAASQNTGEWGGRDLSNDHHSHGDAGGGDSGGGDSGGGADSGGGGGE